MAKKRQSSHIRTIEASDESFLTLENLLASCEKIRKVKKQGQYSKTKTVDDIAKYVLQTDDQVVIVRLVVSLEKRKTAEAGDQQNSFEIDEDLDQEPKTITKETRSTICFINTTALSPSQMAMLRRVKKIHAKETNVERVYTIAGQLHPFVRALAEKQAAQENQEAA